MSDNADDLSKLPPHERGAMLEHVAKALCRLRHSPRSVEEAVAPGRELWMRYAPDAEVAVKAVEECRASVVVSERPLRQIPEANELAAALRDAARWRFLKLLAGYYQDGSETTVKLYQDDALRACFIEAGGKTYGTDGSTFDSAIDAAMKETSNAER